MREREREACEFQGVRWPKKSENFFSVSTSRKGLSLVRRQRERVHAYLEEEPLATGEESFFEEGEERELVEGEGNDASLF